MLWLCNDSQRLRHRPRGRAAAQSGQWRETRLQIGVPEATTRSDASFARFHSGAAGLQGMGRMPTEHNLGWEWGLYE